MNNSLLLIDALQYNRWSETIFRQMREGGLTAVHVTICYHEDFRETVENVLGTPISLPQELADVAGEDSLAIDLPSSYEALKQHMMDLLKA